MNKGTLQEEGVELTPSGIPTRISKDAINLLPLARYEGEIHLVTTADSAHQAVRKLSQSTILGFDTESRPSFRKGDNFPPSIVQFADEQSAYLFQINLIGSLDPIIPLLENPNVQKVGVALQDDIRRLKDIRDFHEAGLCEVTDLSRKLGITNSGLRSLVALVLGKRISKGAQVTNWARHNLSPAQISYAATDAWISRELYLRLAELVREHVG